MLALAACSNAGGSPSGSNGASPRATATSEATATPGAATATPDPTDGATNGGTATGDASPSPSSSFVDIVQGGANESSVYSSKCPMRRGAPCSLDFTGIYFLKSEDTAFIVITATENDSDTPVGRGGVTVQKGSKHWFAEVPVTPSPNAETVTFTIVLQASDGRILARGKTETFKTIA